MPAGIATAHVNTNENRASTTVSISRSPISSTFGRWYSSERPRLPRARLAIHFTYCTYSGWSRPYSWRRAARCSALIDVPEDASVAVYAVRKSPGGAWTMANTTTEKANSSTGRSRRRFRT